MRPIQSMRLMAIDGHQCDQCDHHQYNMISIDVIIVLNESSSDTMRAKLAVCFDKVFSVGCDFDRRISVLRMWVSPLKARGMRTFSSSTIMAEGLRDKIIAILSKSDIM